MNILSLLNGFKQSKVYAMSLVVGDAACRWVYGEVKVGQQLSFHRILASGGCALNKLVGTADSSVMQADDWVRLIRQCIAQLPSNSVKPKDLVVCLSAKHAYFGEITAARDDDELTIRYQVEDLLDAASGGTDREAAFDWQVKTELSDGMMAMAVAGVDQRHVDEIRQACEQLKMECRGITFDNVASLNGYLQMVPKGKLASTQGLLLHGELNKHRIRLAVFSQGVLLNESVDQNEDGFSVVQAISALERLVMTWSRDQRDEQSGGVSLVLGGELMAAKGIELTIRRSTVLSPLWIEIQPRKELAAHWHEDVVPFGALEALPCA